MADDIIECPACGELNPRSRTICYMCRASLEKAEIREYGEIQGQDGITAERIQFAGFWLRFVALFVDGIILNIIFIPVGFIGGFILSSIGLEYFGVVSQFLVGGAYFILFWLYWQGQTPGKRIFDLRIIQADGSPIDRRTSVIRYFSYIVSSIILFIGFFMASFDDQKRALHDRLANTRVIKAG